MWPRVLIIEDEPAIADTPIHALKTDGFAATTIDSPWHGGTEWCLSLGGPLGCFLRFVVWVVSARSDQRQGGSNFRNHVSADLSKRCWNTSTPADGPTPKSSFSKRT